jgi:fructose-bisphosphate aldolase class 1
MILEKGRYRPGRSNDSKQYTLLDLGMKILAQRLSHFSGPELQGETARRARARSVIQTSETATTSGSINANLQDKQKFARQERARLSRRS